MRSLLLALFLGLLAINAECDALCWLDPAAGMCRWQLSASDP